MATAHCPAAATPAPDAALVLVLAILATAAAAMVVLLAPLARAARAAARAARDPAAAVQTALADPRLTAAVTSLLVRTPGGGAVFRGAWGGSPVAVFVGRLPATARRAPCLLGTAAAHPNVVHLFAVRECVVASPDAPSGALVGVDGAPLSLKGALAAAGAATGGDDGASTSPSLPHIETVAVYELCERGTPCATRCARGGARGRRLRLTSRAASRRCSKSRAAWPASTPRGAPTAPCVPPTCTWPRLMMMGGGGWPSWRPRLRLCRPPLFAARARRTLILLPNAPPWKPTSTPLACWRGKCWRAWTQGWQGTRGD